MATESLRIEPKTAVNIQGRTIEIVVGPNQDTFSVHEALIRASSPFFDKVMGGEWKGTAHRRVELPDYESKILSIYIHWLYCGTFPIRSGDSDAYENDVEYLKLVKAYVLGGKLMDTSFQNDIIDAIVEKSCYDTPEEFQFSPGEDAIVYAYKNTTDSAPIRELLVDIYVSQGIGQWLSEARTSARFPQPFLLALAAKLLDQRETMPDDDLEASNYHQQ
ncbi:hypothetical protein BJY04DRAFT_220488 [Aspergillus karnatakaensis]|uniref:BTB/POZ domain-containing protein n=1 Tax=Aspergillus karnatakaensis TaxID=1810916 RepID=UPI003CCD7F82